jgi:hypothetical protein
MLLVCGRILPLYAATASDLLLKPLLLRGQALGVRLRDLVRATLPEALPGVPVYPRSN